MTNYKRGQHPRSRANLKPGKAAKPKDIRKVSVSVTLTPAQVEWLDGKGKRSAIIRALISAEMLRELKDTEPPA